MITSLLAEDPGELRLGFRDWDLLLELQLLCLPLIVPSLPAINDDRTVSPSNMQVEGGTLSYTNPVDECGRFYIDPVVSLTIHPIVLTHVQGAPAESAGSSVQC